MEDTMTSVIASFDLQGKYIDTEALQKLSHVFQIDDGKVRVAALIRDHAATIVKEAVAKSLAGSNSSHSGPVQTSQRYAACIRDLDFYLRYSTYAMLASDKGILDERVLNGLKETYLSLGVSLTATVEAIQAMKEVTLDLVESEGSSCDIGHYFDHLCAGLS
ncbi:MAG: allophycocyanin subunit beta [Acaryochloridaceae cyanobacterium SU_2_1]|nr:allophycocyanin subunit beta [Acaryochloridaceae cyanobacterium SU_2_1]